MKKTLKALLILFLISIPFEANAISPGGIIKVFKGMGKVFKKGADELPDIGKKIEDLKDGNLKSSSKIDEAVNTSSKIDNTSNDDVKIPLIEYFLILFISFMLTIKL